MLKSSFIYSLEPTFALYIMEFLSEIERTEKEEQLCFGNYECWVSLIRMGSLHRSLTNLIWSSLTPI